MNIVQPTYTEEQLHEIYSRWASATPEEKLAWYNAGPEKIGRRLYGPDLLELANYFHKKCVSVLEDAHVLQVVCSNAYPGKADPMPAATRTAYAAGVGLGIAERMIGKINGEAHEKA